MDKKSRERGLEVLRRIAEGDLAPIKATSPQDGRKAGERKLPLALRSLDSTNCGCGDELDELGACINPHCRLYGVADPLHCARWLAQHWPAFWIVSPGWARAQTYETAIAGLRELAQQEVK